MCDEKNQSKSSSAIVCRMNEASFWNEKWDCEIWLEDNEMRITMYTAIMWRLMHRYWQQPLASLSPIFDWSKKSLRKLDADIFNHALSTSDRCSLIDRWFIADQNECIRQGIDYHSWFCSISQVLPYIHRSSLIHIRSVMSPLIFKQTDSHIRITQIILWIDFSLEIPN